MTTVLMANVGTSDIQVDGQRLGSFRRECLEWLQLLREHDDAAETLQLPLLSPMINHIKSLTGAPPTRIVLFVTDQPESVLADQRNKDTYAGGELIAHLMKEESEVGLYTLVGNPSDYVDMHGWFSARMPGLLERLAQELGSIDHLYVGITGGTPASCMNLLQSMLDEATAPFTTLYVNRSTGAVSPGDYGGLMRRAQVLRLFRSLIDRDDYLAALSLAKEAWPTQIGLIGLLQALMHLQLFQFGKAHEALRSWPKGYYERFQQLRRSIELARQGVAALEEGELSLVPSDAAKATISEMWYQATRKYEHGEYVDFMMRFCGLRETLLCHRAQAHLQRPITRQEREFGLCYDTCVGKEDPAGLFSHWAVFGCAVTRLRNQLWLTHGLSGVSADDIKKQWSRPGDIIVDTTEMLASVMETGAPAPSQEARTLLEELVERLLDVPAESSPQPA